MTTYDLHLLTASGLAATVSLTVNGLCCGNNGGDVVVDIVSDINGDDSTGAAALSGMINFLLIILIGLSWFAIVILSILFVIGIFLRTNIFFRLGDANAEQQDKITKIKITLTTFAGDIMSYIL